MRGGGCLVMAVELVVHAAAAEAVMVTAGVTATVSDGNAVLSSVSMFVGFEKTVSRSLVSGVPAATTFTLTVMAVVSTAAAVTPLGRFDVERSVLVPLIKDAMPKSRSTLRLAVELLSRRSLGLVSPVNPT